MALNWQTFRTRALTAIIFAAVMLAGLFTGHWSFFLLFSIIHFGCWFEYMRLIEKIYNTKIDSYTVLGFMLWGFTLMIFATNEGYSLYNYSLRAHPLPFLGGGFAILIMGIFSTKQVHVKAHAAGMAGFLYISLPFALLIYLKESVLPQPGYTLAIPHSILFPIVVIGCMWVNDTMAYIVGSLIGKRPLSSISPKKTWEGTVGGIIAASLLMGWLASLLDNGFSDHSIAWWMALCVVATVAGTFGDLFESKLKRLAGVKDSGNIMPGHGGFLDRFDSLLLAIPCVAVFVMLT